MSKLPVVLSALFIFVAATTGSGSVAFLSDGESVSIGFNADVPAIEMVSQNHTLSTIETNVTSNKTARNVINNETARNVTSNETEQNQTENNSLVPDTDENLSPVPDGLPENNESQLPPNGSLAPDEEVPQSEKPEDSASDRSEN